MRLNKSFEPIELGNIEAKRSFQHAEDVADGLWRMINQDIYNKNYDGHPKEYILSSHETHSVRQLVEIAFGFANIKGCWVNGQALTGEKYDPLKDVFGVKQENGVYPLLVTINPKFFRPAEVELLHGDSSLIRKELGWNPKVAFNELIHEMVEADIKRYDQTKP